MRKITSVSGIDRAVGKIKESEDKHINQMDTPYEMSQPI